MAQRALDRRLTDELMRFKNTIAILTRSARLPSHCRSLLSHLSHHCAHISPTIVLTSVPPLCSPLSHFCAHLCPTFVLTCVSHLCAHLCVPPLCSPLSHLCAHPCPTFAHLCHTFVLTYVCPTFVFTPVPPLCLHLSCHCSCFYVPFHFVILSCVYLFFFFTHLYILLFSYIFYCFHFYDHLLMQISKKPVFAFM